MRTPISPASGPPPSSDGTPPRGSSVWSAEAWARQWPRYHGDLVRYVAGLMAGDTHAAEDVAQETAIRLLRHPEVLATDEAVGGWVRTVARNIVIDRARRCRARPTEVALGVDVDRVGADPFRMVDDDAAIADALATLPPRHRDVVLGLYVRDRSVADVADELGIPAGTVKSRSHHALRKLRAAGLSRAGSA